MKKIVLTFAVAGLFLTGVNAQTTAMNFTKTDCDGNSHTLFSELDNGKVCILEFVMPPSCAPCIQAGQNIQPMYNQFQTSNPGQVKWYSIGYNNSYTCTTMQAWETNNSLNPTASFIQGASEVAYYGGMGMPTIVVVGGSSHKVYYKKQGFSTSDISTIQAAVNTALNEATGVNNVIPKPGFTMYPNPVTNEFTVNVTNNTLVSAEVLSPDGKTALNFTNTALNNEMVINTSTLSQGIYILKLTASNGQVMVSKFNIVR